VGPGRRPTNGIGETLQLAARLTDEETAKQVQPWLDYDPQPPFGGIDYDDMGLTSEPGGRGCRLPPRCSLLTPSGSRGGSGR
jgi:hypothetical protein